jgi:site-specific DNA recombinase
VAGGEPFAGFVVAWSMGPDPELYKAAASWAKRNKWGVLAAEDEAIELGGRTIHTRIISGDIEKVGVRAVCRRLDLAHQFRAEIEAECSALEIPVIDPTAEVTPRVAPEQKRTPRREGESVSERLIRGRYDGARNGHHQSGPAPYGYRRDYRYRGTREPMLAIHPEEAAVVRMIFKEYQRRRSMKKLIAYLDSKGLRTRRGKRWSRAGIAWILSNETYLGRVHFGEVRSKGKHPPIVSPIVFNRANALKNRNNKRKSKCSSVKST